MSLTFYCAPMSTASITEAVLAELGTPHEQVKLSFATGDTKSAAWIVLSSRS